MKTSVGGKEFLVESFSGKLSIQAWMVAPETQKLLQALLEDGGEARFVGGCVRDTLANRNVLDIDIATTLTPPQVIERLKRNKILFAPTGLKHGTITAIVDGHPFEITTLRLDVLTFGRHAEVRFTDDWKTDASRRDFTINSIFATPDGNLYDPFGGVKDLRLGQVLFVGDPEKRIHEDTLRILRFFRFYAHFGRGLPDGAALRACAAAAGQIPKLSAERICREIMKLLESDKCAEVWQIMLQNGIVTHFMPEATNVRVLENLVWLESCHDGKVFALRRFAALIIDVPPKGMKNISQLLRLSKSQVFQLNKMVNPGVPVSMEIGEDGVRKLVYRLGNDMARSLLLLAAAKSGDEERLYSLYQTATSFRAPRFPLLGDDVLALGYEQGSEVGRILDVIENWWIAEDFKPHRTECLKKLKTDFKLKVKSND
ncbi:MAG: CCA tRNA nucleotidyltransferase [Alphaproteobacteria bacterium]|nr:CCA tRNA nucleotidyltransferase [Alphaproteobacteria bacterium]